jgi:hypothetical protein
MSSGFWIGIFLTVVFVIGVSVLIGKVLSRPRTPQTNSRRHEEMMALKASGALKHRKSNRP